jgi:hypothetical protein
MAIIANATAAIFMSAAFLEALVNELIADAQRLDGGHLKSLSNRGLALISGLGSEEAVERASVLAKFGILLQAEGKCPVSLAESPGQDVSIMIRLRNKLLHYKASWLDVGTPGLVRSGSLMESKLYEAMKRKFLHRKGGNPISGDSWLGAGCASWSVRSCIAYTDAVFEKLGITPIYEHVRQNLVLD